MKRQRLPMILIFVTAISRPTFAFTDGPITAAIAVEQKTYDAFMHLQVITQLKTLADNYKASVAYYDLYKQLNSGQGIAKNLLGYMGDTEKQYIENTKTNVMSDWQNNRGTGSDVDKYIQGLNTKAANNVRAVGNSLDSALFAQKLGSNMEKQAGRYTPTAAQNEILRAQAIQIQLLAQMSATMTQSLNYQMKADADEKTRMAVEWKKYQDSLNVLTNQANKSSNPFESTGN